MPCRVYDITNLINGRLYLGSSSNVIKRLGSHRRKLRQNCHDNIALQNAWNKYGEENFEFGLVHECPKDMLLQCEHWMMTQYDFDKNLYNISREPLAPMRGRKHSLETKGRMSKTRKGRR